MICFRDTLMTMKGRRHCLRFVCIALALAVAAPLSAQEKKDDAWARAMFDPQLVLRHARAISLTEAQRKSLYDELRAAQVELAPLQANMMVPALELTELLESDRVDEARAIAKTEEVLRVENGVKRRQMQLIIRVKNLLTPQQQAQLRDLRDREAKGDALSSLPPP